MAQLMFPNIVDAANAGIDRGNQMNFNRLAGQYIGDPSNNSMLLGQAAQINPGAALGIQNAVQQNQQASVQAQQQQQQAQLQKIGGAARYMASALQSNNPAQVDGAWQNVRPFLEQLTGKQTPPTWDPSMEPALYDVIAKTSQAFPSDLTPQKPISVGPDQTLIDPRTHQVIYQGAGDAGTAVEGMTYNGMPVFRDKQGNLKDVRGNPIPQGMQSPQGGQGMPSSLPSETQAYVPKVMAALGGQSPFDASGQPTPQLLDALMRVESGGNPNAVSPAGAQGPYQFMPATAASVGVTDPFDPTQARAGASQYLAQLYQKFGGNAQEAIAAYNAGPGRVSQAVGGAPSQGGLQFNGGGNKAPMGYRFNPDGSLTAIPGGPADKSQSMVGLGDPSLTGQDYLQSVQDPGLRNLISAIADGREQVPRIYRSGKAGEIGPTQIAAAVSQFDPTFNAQDFNSRNRTRISFTSGPDAKNMMNLNQAAAHAQQLVQQIPNLAGHFLPFGLSDPLNSAINNATSGGTAALKNWNTTADALAHEVRSVFAGSSGGTLEELNRNLQTLNGNDPVTSKQAALQTIGRLLQSRIGLLQDKYQQGMGKAGDPFATTYPEAANVLNTLANSDPSTIGYGALKAAQSSVTAPGASPIDALISKYGVK